MIMTSENSGSHIIVIVTCTRLQEKLRNIQDIY